MGGSPSQPDGPCLKGFAYLSQKLVVLPPVGPPGHVSELQVTSHVHRQDMDLPRTSARRQSYGLYCCYEMPSPAVGAAVGGTNSVAGPVVAGTLAPRLCMGRSAIASRCSFLVDFWGAGGVPARNSPAQDVHAILVSEMVLQSSTYTGLAGCACTEECLPNGDS